MMIGTIKRSLLLYLLFLSTLFLTVSCSRYRYDEDPSRSTQIPTELIARTTIPSSTPQMEVTSPSTLPQVIPTPTSGVDNRELNVKLAYLLYQPSNSDETRTSEVWVLEYPSQITRKIFTYDIRSVFFSDPSWSHDGDCIAIDQFVDNIYMITIIDVSTYEETTYQIDAVNFVDLEIDHTLVTPLRWSINDQWIAFTIINTENFEKFHTVILDLDTGKNWLLPNNTEFVAWLNKSVNQFIYLQHTKPKKKGADIQSSNPSATPIIHIGQIGIESPFKTILGSGDATPLGWGGVFLNPNDQFILTISYDPEPMTLGLGNLERETWEELRYHPPPGAWLGNWSPNGNWLPFYYHDEVSFWNFGKTDQPSTNTIPLEDHLLNPVWSGNSNNMVYQDGLKIFKVQPDNPQSPALVLDLSYLKEPQDAFQNIIFRIWVP